MKKSFIYLTFIAAIARMVVSCSKDDEKDTPEQRLNFSNQLCQGGTSGTWEGYDQRQEKELGSWNNKSKSYVVMRFDRASATASNGTGEIITFENEYKDKLEFIFRNYDYLREEDEAIKLPDGVKYDEEGFMTASFYASEMDYCELEQSVREIILCLKIEYDEISCRWYHEDVYKFLYGHKYILSYERSLADPEAGCSLVIRKDTYPENCYAYKRFNTFENALNFREEIHDKFLQKLFLVLGILQHLYCS